jgi:hypothetical protein
VIAYCEEQLRGFSACEVRLLDADVVRSRDMEHVALTDYDTFLTTSLEHIKHDQELIRRLPENRHFVFGVAGFDDPEHFRVFSRPEEIKDRYGHLLSIFSIASLGEEDRKFVVLSKTGRGPFAEGVPGGGRIPL